MPAKKPDATVNRLVIVESPNKVRKIKDFLGKGYTVEASVGHIRDLPTKKTEVPEAQRAKYAVGNTIGVAVDDGFEPLYVVPARSRDQVRKLKSLLKDADELYLATDEDREGEAIAWHLEQELKPTVPVHRMVFHEITLDAIAAAVANPRQIDTQLVDAQEARRIVDRLYGYEVSPVLWRKVSPGLSAGRVQSVATRLVVDRERERMAFVSADYWDLEAVLDTRAANSTETTGAHSFRARLTSVAPAAGEALQRVATGRDFGPDGTLRTAAVALDETTARAFAQALQGEPFEVRSVESKPYTRSPQAPFRTTTLQQEASRKFGFGAARTMQVAQRLYEGGHITYMRTDSTTLSDTALNASRNQVREIYGAQFLPDAPRTYVNKVKNAQEAHEAIRPSGDAFTVPGASGLTGDEFRLYDLIWKRTLASQMRNAVGQTVSVRISAVAGSGGDASSAVAGRATEFAASGTTITFPGFMQAYVESKDEGDEPEEREARLPVLTQGQRLRATGIEADGHSTKPPARFTEATLVGEFEEREIGRPSTYASIIKTILDRGYVFKKGTALVPAWLAFAVVQLLEQHFTELVDYTFTARMEDALDEVAAGDLSRLRMLGEFWNGAPDLQGLKPLVENLGEIDARGVSSVPIGDGYTVRVGRYGPYVEDADGQRGSVPEDLPPDEMTPAIAAELIARGNGDRELGVDPASGHPVLAKDGRYGPYVTEVLGDDAPAKAKPRTASLFKDMSLDGITLEDALRLLTLPRVVGVDPESSEEITAQNGRYGPYLKKGTDSRSLETEEQLFSTTLEQALAIYALPKTRRGQTSTAAAPLRELGADLATGDPLLIKDGRFGPYITDGTTNVTVPRSEQVETITIERASELMADKRAQGPSTVKRAAAKKVTAKKATAKKAATKKTATKKTATKKTATKKTATKKTAAKKTTATTRTVAAKKTTVAKAAGTRTSATT